MSERHFKLLLVAAERVLRPIIRLMVHQGLSEGAFAQLCRQLLVQETRKSLIEAGIKPTQTALSARTGLSRKEVARLQKGDDEADYESRALHRNRLSYILGGWATDHRFSDAGNARPLLLSGSGYQFVDLVRLYGGDTTPKSMLEALLESQCVTFDGEVVTLVTRALIPETETSELLEVFGTDGAEFLATILHNISSEPAERRFQRKVSSHRLSRSALDEFKLYSDKCSMKLLEEYDQWLTDHQARSEEESVYIAVGIYQYESDIEGEEL